MKFLHIADLHIGKTVSGFSLIEDQRHVLGQIVNHARAADAVVIAGDVYDKQMPSGEAVRLFDQFLTDLSREGVAVLLIGGNHDSPERLEFAGRLLAERGIHLYSAFDGAPRRVTLRDAWGDCHFHLLPFIKPAHARAAFPAADIRGYDDAFRVILAEAELDTRARNVLVCHQFAAFGGRLPERSDSEIEPVGGVEAVDARLFDAFDYVALGHLHGPQRVGRDTVRYAGSPLKYSFSEALHNKSAALVTLGAKGEAQVELLALSPLRDMRRVRGTLRQLTDASVVQAGNPEDFLHVTLTDEDEVFDAIGRLRATYPNIMELRFDNARTQAQADLSEETEADLSPMDHFAAFYAAQNGAAADDAQCEKMRALLADGEGEA